jgi:acyl-CoA reductase-like NAD-dependent aldehyde dehydrogenase
VTSPARALAEATSIPKGFSGFDRIAIGQHWRQGKKPALKSNYDPYTSEVIVEIPQSARNDLDDAYTTATLRSTPELPNLRARELKF